MKSTSTSRFNWKSLLKAGPMIRKVVVTLLYRIREFTRMGSIQYIVLSILIVLLIKAELLITAYGQLLQ
jgi:hypothetical protein